MVELLSGLEKFEWVKSVIRIVFLYLLRRLIGGAMAVNRRLVIFYGNTTNRERLTWCGHIGGLPLSLEGQNRVRGM